MANVQNPGGVASNDGYSGATSALSGAGIISSPSTSVAQGGSAAGVWPTQTTALQSAASASGAATARISGWGWRPGATASVQSASSQSASAAAHETSSASSTNTAQSKSSSIGPAVGGALAGVFLLVVVVLVWFYLRRRSSRTSRAGGKEEIDPDPEKRPRLSVLGDTGPSAMQATPLQSETPASQNESQSGPNVAQTVPVSSSRTLSSGDGKGGLILSYDGQLAVSTLTSSTTEMYPSRRPPGDHSTGGLTTDQARLVHDLYKRNVPTEEITAILSEMRNERLRAQAGTSGGGPDLMPMDAPPTYDFKN